MRHFRKWTAAPLLACIGASLAVALLLADLLLAGPMRRWAERTMNDRLQGYTVRIGRVRPHIWRLAFTLQDLVLVQDRHPEPPVADLGALRFSLHWADLLRLKLTGDLVIDGPALHINLAQIQAEARSEVLIQDRGNPPRDVPPDFDLRLRLRLEDASLPDLNPFLLANAGVDVARGSLTVYTEVTVRNGRVEGYLKPLMKDLQVYDRRKDRSKPFGKRVEMHLLQLLAGLFKNAGTRQVATVARFSGPTGDPRFRTWEAVRQLLRNGFIQAIRPGFLGGAGAGPARPAPPPQRPGAAH